MDAFGMHAVGGMAGGILTGFFANDFISENEKKRGVFYGRPVQLGIQLYAIVVVAGWSFFMSGIILMILHKTYGLRVSGMCMICSCVVCFMRVCMCGIFAQDLWATCFRYLYDLYMCVVCV